jgi:hypothetical protein
MYFSASTGILLREEIKALEAMVVLHLGLSQAMEFLDAYFRGSHLRDEFEVALIGLLEGLSKRRQTVRVFFIGAQRVEVVPFRCCTCDSA